MSWLAWLARRVLGVVLILFGIAGLVLPGVQGIALIVTGALLLGMPVRYVTQSISWCEGRIPWLAPAGRWVRRQLDRVPTEVASAPREASSEGIL